MTERKCYSMLKDYPEVLTVPEAAKVLESVSHQEVFLYHPPAGHESAKVSTFLHENEGTDDNGKLHLLSFHLGFPPREEFPECSTPED